MNIKSLIPIREMEIIDDEMLGFITGGIVASTNDCDVNSCNSNSGNCTKSNECQINSGDCTVNGCNNNKKGATPVPGVEPPSEPGINP